VAPVADSPLERAGFEPSVPRWGNYAHETVPFDRYSISRPFSGAAQRIDRCFRRIDQHRQALVEAEAIAVGQTSLLETRDRRGRLPAEQLRRYLRFELWRPSCAPAPARGVETQPIDALACNRPSLQRTT
jgi:hypothetical protein